MLLVSLSGGVVNCGVATGVMSVNGLRVSDAGRSSAPGAIGRRSS